MRLDGADSYLEVDEDGTPVAGVSGAIAAAGDRVDLDAKDALRIRAGNAGAVRLAINGIGIAAMGGDGAVVEWRITDERKGRGARRWQEIPRSTSSATSTSRSW